MRKIATILVAVLSTLAVSAQSMDRYAGIYCPYPDTDNQFHKAPAGYKAVYLAHFGRHGSRYHSSAPRYDKLLAILERADQFGNLTPEGKSILQDVRTVANGAKGHYGALVGRGTDEQRHIMQRLCRNCPELFAGKDWQVEVYASQVPRCLMSMAASTDVIKEFNPKVRFVRHSDEGTQTELFFEPATYAASANAKDFLNAKCNTDVSPQPLLDKFFIDGGKWVMADSRARFGHMLWDIATAAGEVGVDVWKYFTPDEMAPYWKEQNARYYYSFGPSEEFSEVSKDQISGLVGNILTGADNALATGNFRASLRYGHDTQVMPLTDFLGIEGCCTPAAEGQPIEEVWRNCEVSPMGANIQMLFYRKGKSDDILVKVLHNEKEVHLQGIETDCWPFYHWSELRAALYDRLESQPAFTRNGWQRDTVSTGLVYMRYSGYEEVSRSNQLISVVDVDLNNPRYTVDFSFIEGRNSTSDAFKVAGAVATMNASYEKESVFIKTEGTIRYNIQSDYVPYQGAVPQWKTDCAICTDGRRVGIEYTGKGKTIPEMREAYAAMDWPEVISSSPMLIEKGIPVGKYFGTNNLSDDEFALVNYEDARRHQTVRHPRCAVALTADNHMILICVDGRRPGIAEGMNAWELTTFIESQFHPVDAINMDGGGSSAMCVAGRGRKGTNVVNYPSKSPTFKHDMERRVPTHIHIIDKEQAQPKLEKQLNNQYLAD